MPASSDGLGVHPRMKIVDGLTACDGSPSSTAVGARWTVESSTAARTTVTAPITKGTCGLWCSTSFPAAKGASPPPMKRTNP